MTYLEIDRSFNNFWALYQINSSVNVPSMFYLTTRKDCQFMIKLKSSFGRWKDRYFFVRSPRARPWNIPIRWHLTGPRIKSGNPTKDENFIPKAIAPIEYDFQSWCKEGILVNVALSPANEEGPILGKKASQ